MPQITADRGPNGQNSRPAASLRVTSVCRTWPISDWLQRQRPEPPGVHRSPPARVGCSRSRRSEANKDPDERVSWHMHLRVGSAFHEEIDTAIIEIIAGPNDLQLAPFRGSNRIGSDALRSRL